MNVDQRRHIEIWKHGNGIMGRRVNGNTASAPVFGKKIRDVVTQLQPKGEPELQVIRVAPVEETAKKAHRFTFGD